MTAGHNMARKQLNWVVQTQKWHKDEFYGHFKASELAFFFRTGSSSVRGEAEFIFLASQDAQEVMYVSQSVTQQIETLLM